MKHVNIRIHVFPRSVSCAPWPIWSSRTAILIRLTFGRYAEASRKCPTRSEADAPRALLARFRRAARCADDVDLAPAAPNHVPFVQRSHAHASGMASALRHLQADISSPQPASLCGLRDDACTQESIVSHLMFHERGRITTEFLCHVLRSYRQLHLSSCRRTLL